MLGRSLIALMMVAWFGGCGGDDADGLGVGAECTANEECLQGDDFQEVCLTQFTGGYCGLVGCTSDLECPEDAACIAHEDGEKYCFRICIDKIDCNAHRSVDNESNCSSSVTFVDGAQGRKACVPPSSGI